MAQSISQPWLIVGDFNPLMSPKDRLAGALVTLNEIRDFAECVKNMGINEKNGKVITRLGTTNRLVVLEFQVGLTEPLRMMHGWKMGSCYFGV